MLSLKLVPIVMLIFIYSLETQALKRGFEIRYISVQILFYHMDITSRESYLTSWMSHMQNEDENIYLLGCFE